MYNGVLVLREGREMKPIIAICIFFAVGTAIANITGNPVVDGFTSAGNSLKNGIYVGGTANYGYNIYSSVISITTGSNLAISDGSYSWLAGDTVLAVGSQFANITAAEAGWGSFSGNAVNSILGDDTKLQVNFGTSLSKFSASTVAPGSGNGKGALGADGYGGAMQVRTSSAFDHTDWAADSGELLPLFSTSHMTRNFTTKNVQTARLMWIWDAQTHHVGSWEILLNTTLVRRLNPSYSGPDPMEGNTAVLRVQQREGVFTDAIITIPEPATISLLAIGIVAALRKRK